MNEAVKQKPLRFSPNLMPTLSRLGVLILIMLWGYTIDPSFISMRNFSNIFTNASILIVLGIGQTITVITNGPDLSSGSVMTICGVIAAILIKSLEVNFVVAILAALLVGGILGSLNG